MIEQTAAISDIRLIFVMSLIIVVKKDKSWAIVDWNARDIAQLLDPFTCYHKASLVRHDHCKDVLRLINKHWGPTIVVFFCVYYKSKKTLL